MNEPEHAFLPERVDEQIDALAQADREPDARLISHLRAIYSEDREIVEQVEQRLAAYRLAPFTARSEQIDRYSRSASTVRADRQKGPHPVKTLDTERPQKSRTIHLLEILAAVLFITLLVGSMALVFKTRQPSQGAKVSSTPTGVTKKSTTQSPPTISGQKGLYLATTNGIDRIESLQSGKVLWHAGSGPTDNVLVDQDIVVFSGGDRTGPGNFSNYYVEAVNASNGDRVWRVRSGMINTIVGAKGIAYVSSCSPTASCSIDALQISNGHMLWSHSSLEGTIWELYQDGVVYGISYTEFFALNATTGTPVWQQTLQKYPDQEANMTPLVSGGAIYFSSCNTTKQTSTYLACYLFAFNAASGAELWHVPYSSISTSPVAAPAVVDGVVYAGSMDGVIRAYNAQTGSLLWSYNTGGNILNPPVSHPGLVYVEVQENASTMRLLALKASSTSHTIAWSKDISFTEGKPDGSAPEIQQNQLYLIDSNNDILAFQAGTGVQTQRFHPPFAATIIAFSLVA